MPAPLHFERLEDRCLLSAGGLDPLFGTNGQVLTSFNGGYVGAQSTALQQDRKIVVAGFVAVFNQPNTDDFALARYNRDGSLDASFGQGGRVTTDFFGFNDQAHTVLIQPDGKIVLAGAVMESAANSLAGLARYLPDGSLDSSFGTAGKVTASSPNIVGTALLQPDGKILVLTGPGMVRFNSDGSPDQSFDTGSGAGAGSGIATAFALQPDGKIVTAGGASDAKVRIWRINSDGNLDTTYGTGGEAIIPNISLYSTFSTAVVQADGKLVLAMPPSGNTTELMRLDANGNLDASFGTAGLSRAFSVFPQDIVLQSDDKFLLTGFWQPGGPPGPYHFALQRVNNDGSADTGFGSNSDGLVTVSFGRDSDSGAGVAVQSDNNIVVAGYSLDVNGHPGDPSEIAIARFLGSGGTASSPGVLQFSVAGASLPDTDGGLLLRVTRTNGTDGAVTVHYATSDGTAHAGVDYQVSSGALTFNPGETQQILAVNLIDDGAADSTDETLTVTLSAPSGGATLGAPSTVTVTIQEATTQAATDDNALFVTGLYHDLLGRAPDAAGLAGFQQVLDAARLSLLGPIAAGIVTSAEYRSDVIERDYSQYLGRAASPDEVSPWLQALQHGLTPEQLAARIVSSSEYFRRAGGTNSGWLDHIYLDLLGRARDPSSQGFLDALNGGTPRASVVSAVIGSPEYDTRLIVRVCSTFLGRQPSPSEIPLWLAILNQPPGGTGSPAPSELFLADVLGSSAYLLASGQTAVGWTTRLYTDLLGRRPDVVGLNSAVTAVQFGYQSQRAGVTLAFLSSGEYQGRLVSGYYQTYLHRAAAPAPTEIGPWVAAMQQGESPEQVISAFLGSPEYFQIHAGDNSQWLAGIYQDVLGRTADSGAQGFLTALNHGATRQQIGASILHSAEFQSRLVTQVYQTYLGRPPNGGEMSAGVVGLANGETDARLLASVLATDEYFQLPHR